MLEEKTYTISEIAAIIGGSSDRQAIKRKLELEKRIDQHFAGGDDLKK